MGDVIKMDESVELDSSQPFESLPEQQQRIIAATNLALVEVAYRALLSVRPLETLNGERFFRGERTSALFSLEALEDEIECFLEYDDEE